MSLAAGFASASDHPGLSGEKLLSEADKAMYAEKAARCVGRGLPRRF